MASSQPKLKCLCHLSFKTKAPPRGTVTHVIPTVDASEEQNSNPTFPSRAWELHNTGFSNRQTEEEKQTGNRLSSHPNQPPSALLPPEAPKPWLCSAPGTPKLELE